MWCWLEFITIIVMVFALGLLLFGLLAIIFGTGKGRKFGILMTVLGLLIGIGYGYMAYTDNFLILTGSVDLSGIIVTMIQYLLATLIGAVVAIGVFIMAIMKS